MKILYVATDRRAAELAAYALRNIAHDVKVSWAGSQSAAMTWAEGNRDIAALIFEATSTTRPARRSSAVSANKG